MLFLVVLSVKAMRGEVLSFPKFARHHLDTDFLCDVGVNKFDGFLRMRGVVLEVKLHQKVIMNAPSSFRIAEMAQLLIEILAEKESLTPKIANTEGLLNLFRIGTSAGGMRPKILVARHRKTNQIMPGDLLYGPHHEF